MVTRFIFLLLLIPFFLFSGEFIASVNRNQVGLGESFTLNLALKDASARGVPPIDSLRKLFLVHGQQQSSNTVIVNGKVSSSLSWIVTLIPQEEGDLVIPSMEIETSEGKLLSEPITIHVEKGSFSNSESSGVDGVNVVAEISNDKPYKNEPVIYTVKLFSERNLANLQLHKIDLEDCILEANGEPKIYDKIINGVRFDIVEFSYLITPLKAGGLKIPPAVIQGGIPIKRKGHGGSIFDMMQGFERLDPFALKTKEIFLDVQPPVAGIVPWLPVRNLQIEEVLDDSQGIQEGEPFTRSFKIRAEGIRSDQLPSLNDLQINSPFFKVYADKPEFGDEIKEGRVSSYRKERYTLIPQKSGELTLPEISLAWFDVLKKEKVISKISAKTFQVLPSVHKIAVNDSKEPLLQESQEVIIQRDPILYIVIGALVFLLMGAVFFGINLQKKIARLTAVPDLKKSESKEKLSKSVVPPPIKKEVKSDKKEKLPDLNPT